MTIERKIAFVGGDLRFLTAAKCLGKRGYECAVCGFHLADGDLEPVTRCTDLASAVGGADAVVLPLPYCTDGRLIPCPLGRGGIKIETLLALMKKGQRLFGGCVDEKLVKEAEKKGIVCTDYYIDEALCIRNAVPTAEGALAVAMNEMPVTLHGAHACVLGYGRIGKVLARLLRCLGGETTVVARKAEDRAWAEASGHRTLDIPALFEGKESFDVIFNTIPSRILTGEKLALLDRDTLLIDLASKPGGIDFESAKELGLKCIWALSLPGKCSPVSAGRAIAETLHRLLCEEGRV